MSDKLMKAFIAKSGNVVMCQMRMMYANLITPGFPSKTERREEKKQWAVLGLIPAGADISVLEKEINRVIGENLTEKQRATTKVKHPIKRTAEQASLAHLAEDFPYFIQPNAKCFDKSGKPRPAPEIVDAKGKPIAAGDEADELYNGRWFRPSVNPYFYDNENKGVSLGLSNVQLLRHDEPLAGGKPAASSEFEAVDGELDDLETEFVPD